MLGATLSRWTMLTTRKAGRSSMACYIASPARRWLQEPQSASKRLELTWRMTMSDTDGTKVPSHGMLFIESRVDTTRSRMGTRSISPAALVLKKRRASPGLAAEQPVRSWSRPGPHCSWLEAAKIVSASGALNLAAVGSEARRPVRGARSSLQRT